MYVRRAISSEGVRLFPVATQVQPSDSDGNFNVVMTRPSHTSPRRRPCERGREGTSERAAPKDRPLLFSGGEDRSRGRGRRPVVPPGDVRDVLHMQEAY